MQGRILDFSIQNNVGAIRGDDGNRYSFTGENWRAATPPRVGTLVDFDTAGSAATDIYAAAVSSPPHGAAPGGPPVTAPATGAPAGAHPAAVAPISKLGTLGMIAGFLAIIFFQTTLLGFPLMLAGWVLSIIGLVTGTSRGERVGFAIAGILLSSVPFLINVIIAISVHSIVGSLAGRSGGWFKAIISQIVPFV